MGEEDIVDAVSPIFDGRVFFGIAPLGTPRPYLSIFHAGGMTPQVICGPASKSQVRLQFTCWGSEGNRTQHITRMREAMKVLTAPPLSGVDETGLISRYDADAKLYGAMADVSFWFFEGEN